MKKKNTIYKRLVELQDGTTLRAFGEKIGVGQSTLHNYLKGRIPKADFIGVACDKMNVNDRWLISGKGPKYRDTNVDIEKARALDVAASCKMEMRAISNNIDSFIEAMEAIK